MVAHLQPLFGRLFLFLGASALSWFIWASHRLPLAVHDVVPQLNSKRVKPETRAMVTCWWSSEKDFPRRKRRRHWTDRCSDQRHWNCTDDSADLQFGCLRWIEAVQTFCSGCTLPGASAPEPLQPTLYPRMCLPDLALQWKLTAGV